ncbi:MAG: ferric reductase-like transmembrane domain-containing protein [Propioniciclava sp.]
MTATLPPQHATRITPGTGRSVLAERYRAQHRRRAFGQDALYVTAWLTVAFPLAFWLHDGGWAAMTASLAGLMTGVGILCGLVATSAMMIMLWLSARVPVIDRTIGHDRALALHKDLGQWTFVGLLLHGSYLVIGYALADHITPTAELAALWGIGDVALAVIAIGLFAVVAISSVAAARRRLGHEVWQAIHLATYAAILIALPHQFTVGGLFAEGPARWAWLAMWGATFFVIIAWRIFLPLFTSWEHRLVVDRVIQETADTVSIELRGVHLDRLDARAGQFLNWRFLARGLWWHQHPFSLSAAPRRDRLRITVRELGEGTRRLATTLKPGTRVMIEGPYGVFTESARTSPDVVMVAFGIGVAPVRSLLEETGFEPGHATVIVRAGAAADLAHLPELTAWCEARGARLHIITGHRGSRADASTSWLPDSHAGLSLADLAGPLAQADLYICGPEQATRAVIAEAKRSGVSDERIHHEAFTW